MALRGKTVVITGASRGIGLAIGKRAAADGANVAILAKTTKDHPKLPGTIYSAAKEIEAAGGKALPLYCDIRDEKLIKECIDKVVETFGGIDILINNASAISLTGTLQTPMKRYDLMHTINSRGTFAMSQACLPHLLNASNPHVMAISPPLDMDPKWFAPHTAYTLAKYGMSTHMMGMAAEFKDEGVAFNCLWPRTAIATAAMDMLGGEESFAQCRKDTIMADAAYAILTRSSKECTGNFFIDDEVLLSEGLSRSDLDKYSFRPGADLMIDLFVGEPIPDYKGQSQPNQKINSKL